MNKDNINQIYIYVVNPTYKPVHTFAQNFTMLILSWIVMLLQRIEYEKHNAQNVLYISVGRINIWTCTSPPTEIIVSFKTRLVLT